jgi:tRNA(fMet)-specific endonuclease VapC
LEAIFSAIEILPLEESSDHRYAELRTSLENRGKPIGPNDMLIAAHALALDCIVITANVGGFTRVSGYKSGELAGKAISRDARTVLVKN